MIFVYLDIIHDPLNLMHIKKGCILLITKLHQNIHEHCALEVPIEQGIISTISLYHFFHGS
jgi:hypothetical protein